MGVSFIIASAIAKHCPSIIVKYGDEVVGYALTAFKEASLYQPEMVPMIEHLETLSFNGKSVKDYPYYIMGQVCIAKTHRGKGIFEMLYQHHKAVYQSQFELLVTEVSTSNHRSVQAHKKVGFKTIDTYRDAVDEWDVVVWDWRSGILNVEF
jgi:GNAT superfamily N-acetyltransferase